MGNETHTERNDFGQVMTQTDPLGRTTRFYYDDMGNLTSSIDAAGTQTDIIYHEDIVGLPVEIMDAEGNSTTYEYDAKGNLSKVTDPQGNITQYQYDERGLPDGHPHKTIPHINVLTPQGNKVTIYIGK